MTAGLDLDQYTVKNRVLLISAPDPEGARYREQHVDLDENRDALDDRMEKKEA